MKVMLLGAGGQVGRELSRCLPAVCDLVSFARDKLDIANDKAVANAVQSFGPDVIINAAAYTAVDRAENEHALCKAINTDAVANLAEISHTLGSWLIHYSTDYVFDGEKLGPYLETDTANPINVYGQTKLHGEQAIASSGCKHFIFRTTWVIGAEGKNFAKTILKLATQRDNLNVVSDQYGAPTSPKLIASVTIDSLNAIKSHAAWPSGIYHLAARGCSNWHEIAQTLIRRAKERSMTLKLDSDDVCAIATTDYPTPAQRPLNSQLNTEKLSTYLSFPLPDWKNDFLDVADQIITEQKRDET